MPPLSLWLERGHLCAHPVPPASPQAVCAGMAPYAASWGTGVTPGGVLGVTASHSTPVPWDAEAGSHRGRAGRGEAKTPPH